MRVYSLLLVILLTLTAAMVYAQDASDTTSTTTTTTTTTDQGTTICVPTPSATTTCVPGVCGPEAEQFNANSISCTYGIPVSTITDLRRTHDWGQIYFMANMSAKTGRPISEIASLVDQGMSCNDIACKYGTTLAAVSAPFCATPTPACPPIGAGPAVPTGLCNPCRAWIIDRYGNTILSPNEERMFHKMGYSWTDIAVASNLAALTGRPVYEELRWTDTGLTWPQVAYQQGIDPNAVMDISNYPFEQANAYGFGKRATAGAGPGACAQPCPPGTVPTAVPVALPCGPYLAPVPGPARLAAPPCPTPCPAPCPPGTTVVPGTTVAPEATMPPVGAGPNPSSQPGMPTMPSGTSPNVPVSPTAPSSY